MKGSPLSFLALGPYETFMARQDLSANGQAYTCALIFVFCVESQKHFKNLLTVLRLKANPVVGDTYSPVMRIANGVWKIRHQSRHFFDRYRDVGRDVSFPVFNGVADKVDKDLLY